MATLLGDAFVSETLEVKAAVPGELYACID